MTVGEMRGFDFAHALEEEAEMSIESAQAGYFSIHYLSRISINQSVLLSINPHQMGSMG